MAENTNIEWTDATLNVWEGCQKVSLGCKNCYAETLANRYGKSHWGPKSPRRLVVSHLQILNKILRRVENGDTSKNGTKSLMVFLNDISDCFEDFGGPVVHPDGMQMFVGDGQLFTQSVLASRHRDGRPASLNDLRQIVFGIVENNPDLIFQMLTKRPENVMRMVPEPWREKFPDNVWIGTSVEDQKTADERIPHLLMIPAAVRFLSCEPLLGPIDLNEITLDQKAWPGTPDWIHAFHNCEGEGGIQWVIVGGESGPNARPMHPDWALSLRDQCQAAGVPFFFKQWGEWCPGEVVSDFMPISLTARWIDADDGHTIAERVVPASEEMHRDDEPEVYRLGKKRAGRFLDGREWSEFPEAAIG